MSNDKPTVTTKSDYIDVRDFSLLEAAQTILGMVSGRLTNKKVTDAYELISVQMNEMRESHDISICRL